MRPKWRLSNVQDGGTQGRWNAWATEAPMIELCLAEDDVPPNYWVGDLELTYSCTMNEDSPLSRSSSAVLLSPQPQPHEKLRSRSRFDQ